MKPLSGIGAVVVGVFMAQVARADPAPAAVDFGQGQWHRAALAINAQRNPVLSLVAG